MVIGKLKYLIGPANGMIIHPLLNVGSGWSRHAAAEWSDSVVEGMTRVHGPERKEKSRVGGVVSHTGVLGSHG